MTPSDIWITVNKRVSGTWVEVQVAPEAPGKLQVVQLDAVHLAVQLGEGLQRERPAALRGRKPHCALHRAHLHAVTTGLRKDAHHDQSLEVDNGLAVFWTHRYGK